MGGTSFYLGLLGPVNYSMLLLAFRNDAKEYHGTQLRVVAGRPTNPYDTARYSKYCIWNRVEPQILLDVLEHLRGFCTWWGLKSWVIRGTDVPLHIVPDFIDLINLLALQGEPVEH